MSKFYLFFKAFLTVILLTGTIGVWAQGKTVTGRVTASEDGSALPGVNIIQKGTSNGSVSDSDGNFRIIVDDNAVLVFSFVGYVSQEISVASQSSVDVVLVSDVSTLSEIVVIGYGQVERKDVTGSIVAIDSKAFNRGVMGSPQELLLGKVAGVQMSSNDGAPGAGARIRIRGQGSLSGSSDPLIVIDGFPVDNNNGPAGLSNALATINPADIETYTILKDASATAIYGSRASNGVIMITTKKGKEGKPTLSYTGQVSAANPIDFIDVMDGNEYRALIDELKDVNGLGIDANALARLGTANTDWQKEIFRTAVSHDHNLSLSGTAGNFPYRISYGYTDQQGTLKGTDLSRHSLNINLNPSFLNDNLKINASIKASQVTSNFGETGAIGSAVGFDPTQPIKNGNERYGGYFTWTSFPNVDGVMDINGNPNSIAGRNPVAQVDFTDNQGKVRRMIASVQADYSLPFLPELRVNVSGGIDYATGDGRNNVSRFAGWNAAKQQVNVYTSDNQSLLFDAYLNYVKTIGDHKVDATVGYSDQDFRKEEDNLIRSGAQATTYEVNTEGDTVAFVKIPLLNHLKSFFGRVNYTYKGKYLLTATLRNDISSRYSKDTRSGYFPAVALAWRMKEEGFLAGVTAISDLKLRAGWGQTGQQDVTGLGLQYGLSNAVLSYPYMPLYVSSNPTAQYQFGDTFYNTLRPSPYDANLKWEAGTTINLGLDFGFLAGKLTGSIEVYQRKSSDLLAYIPIAAGSNFSNYLLTNSGKMTNKGIELTINAQAIKTADFSWNIGFNASHNKNEIEKLLNSVNPNYQGDPVGPIGGAVGNNIQINAVGFPATSFYVFQQIYDAQGHPIEGLYVDRTGTGGAVTGNNLNKYKHKSPFPDALFGINSTLAYKKFDFYFSGRLSLGNYVYNNGASGATFNGAYVASGFFNNIRSSVNDTQFITPQYFSDHYVENASFFKMDNMSLGYNFTRIVSEKLKGRVSFTVQNAFMVTKYSGLDPEVPTGIDNNLYPRSRTFLVGFNLTY